MRKGVATAGCVAFIATAAVSCGTAENLSAGARIQQAVDKLGEQKAVTVTLGFDGTEQEIWSAMKGQKDFTRDSAKLLEGLDVSLSLSAKKPLKDSKDNAIAFSVSTGEDKPLVEIRSVGSEKFYVRADLKQLLSLAAENGAGDDAESEAELKEFQSMIDQAGELPSSYQSVKDALGGEWISIDPDAFEEFSQSMGGSGSSPFPDTDALDTKTQQEIIKALRKAIGSNAEFTDAGSQDGTDHVKVTVPAAKTATALTKALKPFKDQLPDGFDPAGDLKDAPKKNITLDVAIKDGVLSGVTLDVAQLDKDVKGELPLSVGFTADAQPVKAPAGATTLNPQDIMGALMQLMTGSADGFDSEAA